MSIQRVEVQLEAVPRLLALRLTMEQVAEALGLSVEQVRQAAQNQQPSSYPTGEVLKDIHWGVKSGDRIADRKCQFILCLVEHL